MKIFPGIDVKGHWLHEYAQALQSNPALFNALRAWCENIDQYVRLAELLSGPNSSRAAFKALGAPLPEDVPRVAVPVPPEPAADLPRREQVLRWMQRVHASDAAPEMTQAFQRWLDAEPARQNDFIDFGLMCNWLSEYRVKELLEGWLSVDMPELTALDERQLNTLYMIAEQMARRRRWYEFKPLLQEQVLRSEEQVLTVPTRDPYSLWLLNTRSQIRYRFDNEERRMQLLEGELFMQMALSRGWPFTLQVGAMELSEIGGRCRVRLLLDGSVDITVFQGFVTLRRAGRGQLDVEHLDVEGCAHVHIKGTTPHVEQLHRHLELPQWVQERSALGKSIPVVESEALREARQEQAIARMAALPRILTSATAFNELSDWLRRDETHLTLFRENYTANKQAKIDQTSLDKSRLQRLARAPLIPQQALFSDESLHTARKSAAVADPEQALGWLQKLIAAENADTIDAELGAWLRVSPTRRDLYFEFFSLWNYLLHTRLKVLLAGGLQAPPLPDIATLNARGLREFAIAEALREQQVDRVMACEFPQPQESVSAAQPQFVGQLPDDSHLILAPLSRVRRNYTYGRREITLLQGMMVMNLKPSPCQPFFLRVGELEACGDSGVLGARVLQDAVWLWSQVGSFSVRHMTDKPNSTPLNGCECVELSAQGLRWRPISDVEVIGLQHGLSPP